MEPLTPEEIRKLGHLPLVGHAARLLETLRARERAVLGTAREKAGVLVLVFADGRVDVYSRQRVAMVEVPDCDEVNEDLAVEVAMLAARVTKRVRELYAPGMIAGRANAGAVTVMSLRRALDTETACIELNSLKDEGKP